MPEFAGKNAITLAQLFPTRELGKYASLPVGPLRLDSREVTPGDTFIAVTGSSRDGASFIASATTNGAALIIAEGSDFIIDDCGALPVVRVPQLRRQISEIAALWFGRPSARMDLIGITGTNGKTTCCQWLAQLLNGMALAARPRRERKSRSAAAVKAATIGTLGYGLVGDRLADTGLTTPDAVSVQAILAELLAAGANTVVAEVSSHSLDQDRVAAVDFDAAVFTNIGRDHLDYHGSLANYVAAKARLMKFSSLKAAVINLDDPYAPDFLQQTGANVTTISYSIERERADFSARKIRYHASGTEARLLSPQGEFALAVPIWGEFNLRNLLAVLAAGYALGYPVAELVKRLNSIRPVPGRLESVGVATDITVLIDYAHTADALQSVLSAVRQHIKGNVWCVFGCGGDRDKGKRPLMAQVAEALADYVVVTSDNPRSENPTTIIDDIVSGFQRPQAVHRIEDRETAIRFAVEQAAAGDCVLLAGKGHEAYQLVGSRRLPFSDSAVARLALQVRPATTRLSGGHDD
ncbi:UDP-N-acetylmuramoyl-L-alanyl-D-glutamate--2,6-diaminopimelate ligase [Pseudomaricurvus alcaniphilus]|uniref:UDP-N-acetylmuramoyl-L-alanyl-D-glutamate--2, 6-diaminopimelate ligase n=1 Tax=Pseudomaricurvus alcaniphilus TaxID=1166482 RepID=UPI00140CA110|nr:UDP-N-acetylmuramoyl-L-alanyl-D-glutamate--2,6-diaminopimelate ligase [Pseudomaricurvus alcaniphilus]NHN38125.1 UDP-N-acetylmuramoyl-L-alanyl-D-glutamate--2,6-diaminopimelate ligase [Pseudomaricurvus alcaniphilus]